MQFTILIVDDDTANIRVLSSLLKDRYRVLVAKSGQDALNKTWEFSPDLILLDIIMPDMDGFEVIKTLKSSSHTKAIPVIFITGLESNEDEEYGLRLGASDYIQKPFHNGIVKARVKNQLESVHHKRLLEDLAHIDVLTELPNRRKWKIDSEKTWQDSLHKSSYIAVGIIDVDSFKKYNDHYGHSLGDIALVSVAQAAKSLINQFNGELYRFGGEEFIFIIPNKNLESLQQSLNEICPVVADLGIEHHLSGVTDHLTVSVGVCVMPASQQITIKRMLERADELLFIAKDEGKNRLIFSEECFDKRKDSGIESQGTYS